MYCILMSAPGCNLYNKTIIIIIIIEISIVDRCRRKLKHHNKESIYLQYSLGRLITYSCSLKSTIKQGTKFDGVDLLQESPILNVVQNTTLGILQCSDEFLT